MTLLETKTSPMMAQWQECKEEAPDALLFFRLGDFYEAFYEDAVICSKELELTLTKRQTVPMSGVPSHTLDGYVDKLVSKGYKVAIAEQVEEAKEAKGLVKRAIVRIVTPGTLIDSSLLQEKSNNYIASIIEVGKQFGLAFFDVSCADCRVIEMATLEEAFSEIYRFYPKEVISSRKMHEKYPEFFKDLKTNLSCMIDFIENWRFDHELCVGFLTRLFHVRSLEGFGLKGHIASINAAGALLSHIKETLHTPLGQVQSLLPYSKDAILSIDKTTLRNLDLFQHGNTNSKKCTLLFVLDHTETPMGARLLKRWILEPLLALDAINERHDAIEELLISKIELQKQLCIVRDLERLIVKIGNIPSPRDVAALKVSLEPLSRIKKTLTALKSSFFVTHSNNIDNFDSLIQLIDEAIVEEPPLRTSEGGIFKTGYSEELDLLRALAFESKEWVAKYQHSLREATGIKTLRVSFTRGSGFYIEVSKGQADKIPSSFHRRQTLTNAERYMTPDLKEFEEKILSAEEKIVVLESSLFKTVKDKICTYTESILKSASSLAHIDCLTSLSIASLKYRYVRPKMDLGQTLEIIEGRHPVIEASSLEEKFIPNDTLLDDELNRLMLITGPNMAGKSTYIRQVALIVIMAQMGSFVPAKHAHIGIIDKVFTRIGASDDLSKGQSTFMVEMIETAAILHHATSKSLVILDEIGRGTSTYDGISLAWSIAEFLLTTSGKMAKTLFATHYWELTKLEEKLPGAVNFNVAVHEKGDQILFLRKIIKGGTDKSYGIHVARLAGLPLRVVQRAQEILQHLEENSNQKTVFEAPRTKRVMNQKPPIKSSEIQLSLLDGM